MSTTLLQAFTFALADYVTEYKLLPTLYNNQRHGSLEPPSSPRSINTVKFADDSSRTFYSYLFLTIHFFQLLFSIELFKLHVHLQLKQFQQRLQFNQDV
jgi:hypothetical protein